MSAPKYNSSAYDSAAKKYQQLVDQYTGENGMKASAEQATKDANNSAIKSGMSAYRQAVAQGMGKARAARAAQTARANAYQNQYNNSFQNAAALNNQKIANQGTLVSGAQAKDQNRYSSDQNRFNAVMGAIGGGLNALGGFISDENEKIIWSESGEKCDMLLDKLRSIKL